MNMFTKLLETLGNNFWLIIILCLEVILAVWLLCFARGKRKIVPQSRMATACRTCSCATYLSRMTKHVS